MKKVTTAGPRKGIIKQAALRNPTCRKLDHVGRLCACQIVGQCYYEDATLLQCIYTPVSLLHLATDGMGHCGRNICEQYAAHR